jgi:hypothetical protein
MRGGSPRLVPTGRWPGGEAASHAAPPRTQRVGLRSIVAVVNPHAQKACPMNPRGKPAGYPDIELKEDGADAAFPDQPKLGLR